MDHNDNNNYNNSNDNNNNNNNNNLIVIIKDVLIYNPFSLLNEIKYAYVEMVTK